MACLCYVWTLLVMLAAGAPMSGAQDTITIVSMEWTIDDNTDLVVCSNVTLLGDTATLLIGQEGVGVRDYVATGMDAECATFADPAVPPTDLPLGYQIIVADSAQETLQVGQVTYTLAISSMTVKCGFNDFVRFHIKSGNYSEGSCLPGGGSDPLDCYVPAAESKVCVLGLDDPNGDPPSQKFEVCVKYTPDDSADNPGTLDVTSLTYADGSVNINTAAGSVLTDLIFAQGDSDNSNVTECDEQKCKLGAFLPSADAYNLCGVYTDEDGVIVSTENATFQDLAVTVAGTDPYLDFQLVNMFANRTYKVYSGDDSITNLDPDTATSLDCTRVGPEGICYGFLGANSNPKLLAVTYSDDTNVIITETGL